MPTVEERKFELRQKRSDALMAKINVLRARDGSVAPPINSMKEEDAFNLGLLFGASYSDSINWGAMGVEGLIRCYYEIQNQLSGKVRNNIIKVGTASGNPGKSHNTSSRSGLGSAVKLLGDGMGFTSGFYCGWRGVDVEAADEDNMTKKQNLNSVMNAGSKGDFDVPMTKKWTELSGKLGKPDLSTSFTSNIDKYKEWDGSALVMTSPPDIIAGSLIGLINDLVTVIGSDSQKGPHNATWSHNRSKTPWSAYVNSTLLGWRHRDVAPYSEKKWTSSTILLFTTYTSGYVKHGNGSWDNETSVTLPSGYTHSADYWTSAYDSKAQAIINKLNSILKYIGYTKITNFTYLVNHLIIPGIDITYDPLDPESNIGSSWNMQNAWMQQLTAMRDRLQYSIDYISARKESSSKTKPQYRRDVDNEIAYIQSVVGIWQSQASAISSSVESVFLYDPVGKKQSDITNPLTMYGHRYMWIRTLIHATEGTMTAINATQMAIDMMQKKLEKAEEELLMFGLLSNKWIPTPLIVGIEPYPVLNQATYEMEIGGWLVAWSGQEHCIGYDIWKSIDYDPATKRGTWKKVEISNTAYSLTDINANNGRVLTYIIDDDVEPIANDVDQAEITNPYYKVKAYDINAGSGDYARDNSESEISEVLNPAAFPLGGDTGSANTSGPRRDPVEVTDVSGSSIPPNTLFWVTNFKGSEALDFERRIFESESPFDSTASNLIVFVDGRFKNIGATSAKGDYELIDTYKIRFNESIPLESEVNLVVALRSFTTPGSDGGSSASSSVVKGSAASVDDLPKSGSGGTNSDGDFIDANGNLIDEFGNLIDSDGNFIEGGQVDANGNRTDEDGNIFDSSGNMIGPNDGDLYYVADPAPGEYYMYNDGIWEEVPDPNAASVWRSPVNSFAQLPTQLNADGDVRLALKDSTLYRWKAEDEAWVKVSGAAGGGWLSPVDTLDDLDELNTDEIASGTIVFVLEEEGLYRWSATKNTWLSIAGSNAINWKAPVNDFDSLPLVGNSDGDIRLDLDENKMYRWFGNEQVWKITKSEADIAHTQLNDEDWEIVEDHDVRYYPKTEIDVVQTDVEKRLQLLETLKPKNAESLSGDFTVTGTRLYEGYLSGSDTILNYDTLRPDDYFRRIIKDNSFILSNHNTQQFNNGDIGILNCYINNQVADTFNLGEWFNESERAEGQSYPRQMGINNIIEIMSVGPYNQYVSYQRADFQLNISASLLVQGENSIRLEHEVGNITNDINVTDNYIIFWDEFDGYMGFKDINLEEEELVSEKYLSGVRYYSIGDRLKLSFKVENLFNNTYVKDEQILINGSNFGIAPIYTNYEDANVLGNPVPSIGEDVYYLNEFTVSEENTYSSQPILYLEATNPFTTYKQEKSNTNLLINTVNFKSEDNYEQFLDEYYRQPIGEYDTPPTVFNQWNSEERLSEEDLFVFGGKLQYPDGDFSNYSPNNIVNYNSSAGTRKYIRAFKDTEPHSNGKFIIDGFYNGDANIKVDIKLPGLTGWMSLNNKYNSADFEGEDGDGCLVENNSFGYEWTSGEYNTANSGNMIMLRVTMYRNTTEINSIKLEW